MKTRFDLEQEIMNCWHVVDDISMLTKRYLDGPQMTEDEVANVLIGIESIYKMRFESLFNTFEDLVTDKSI